MYMRGSIELHMIDTVFSALTLQVLVDAVCCSRLNLSTSFHSRVMVAGQRCFWT